MIQIVLVVAYTSLFVFLIHQWKFFLLEGIPDIFVKGVFILKVIAGSSLGLLYTYYYQDRSTADTFKFFDDSRVMFDALFVNAKHFLEMFTGINGDAAELHSYYEKMNAWNSIDVLFNDNKTLVRLNVVFHFFSLGNYYVHVVFLNFLSFIGLVSLFKLFQSHLKNKSREIFFGVMLLPSVLFWGSGLLKDGLLLFAFGTMLYSFNKLLKGEVSKKIMLLFFLGLFLLVFTKLYILITIIPGMIAWWWSKNDSSKKIFLKFILCYAVYLFIGFNIGLVSSKYDVTDILYYKQHNFYLLASNTHANSTINIPLIEDNALSILFHAPAAILRVLMRPNVFDSRSPLIFMAAFENIFILLFLLMGIWSAIKNRVHVDSFFWFSIFFFLCMYALIGLITPILGAMVRYKVPVLPFLMFIIISLLATNTNPHQSGNLADEK